MDNLGTQFETGIETAPGVARTACRPAPPELAAAIARELARSEAAAGSDLWNSVFPRGLPGLASAA